MPEGLIVKSNERTWLAVSVGLAIVVFARTFGFPFVQWDDNILIVDNPLMRLDFGTVVPAAFTSFLHGDYMPLTLLSYWIDGRLGGGQAWPFHVGNVILHVANIVVWACVLKRWGARGWGLWLALIAFSIHPLQVESVAWASERKGLLATLLLGVGAWWAAVPSPRGSILYPLFYLASLFAKASGVAMPLALAAADGLVAGRSRRDIVRRHAPALVLGAVFTVWRVRAYASSLAELGGVASSADHWVRLPGSVLATFGFYLAKFAVPVRLSIIYPRYSGVGDWWPEMVVGAAAIAAVAWLVRLRRAQRAASDGDGVRRTGWVLVSAAAAVVLWLPVMQIVPRINFVNDRYVYLASLALAGFVGGLIAEIFRAYPAWVSKRVVVLGVIAGVWTLASVQRVSAWADDDTLWRVTVATTPWSGLAQNNYAQMLQRHGDWSGAFEHYRTALVVGRDDGTNNLAFNNLGNMLSNPQAGSFFNLPIAERLYRDGIQRATRPEDTFELRYNLALTLLQAGKPAEYRQELLALRDLLASSTNVRYQSLRATVEQRLKP